MKRRGYHFKYLLYPGAARKFTREEAVRLATEANETKAMLGDLSTRSDAYRKKVLGNLKRHKDILSDVIRRVRSLLGS